MTPEAQRIAIAEACGWKFEERFASSFKDPTKMVSRGNTWKHPKGFFAIIPNYLSDLNAMHEAEKTLVTRKERDVYHSMLAEIVAQSRPRRDNEFIWQATAAQRAEAFLRTLNLWDHTK